MNVLASKSIAAQPPLIPKIFGFEDLIVSKNPPGLPFGATVLLTGPPGAGKTTFALGLARGLMRTGTGSVSESELKAKSNPDGDAYIIYYISSEITLERLQKMFWPFGWFPQPNEKSDLKVSRQRLFRIGSQQPDEESFYCIVPQLEVDRPVPTAEDSVNAIFNRLAKALSPGEAPTERRRVIIIVDSITALLKGCASESEERRQTHEILHRLKAIFHPNQLALVLLIAEQALENPESVIPSVEDYLADFVFRLNLKALSLGRRVRTLDVVKSQGVDISVGEHTWVIATNETVSRIFKTSQFIKTIALLGKEEKQKDEDPWATIAIFPRPRLHHDTDSKERPREKKEIDPGIAGLRTVLTLNEGTTTLVVGPMAAGKTELCCQFLLRDAIEAGFAKRTAPANVLFSFGLDAKIQLDRAWERVRPEGDSNVDQWVTIFEFTQSQFDFNRLVAHVNWALEKKPRRVAFDGLSEWLSVMDRAEATRMVEALLLMVTRHKRLRPTVFFTYAMSLGDDPLGPQALGVNADNIVVVRPINIHDEIRKIIYVIKGDCPDNEDQNVRELRPSEHGLVVRRGLDSFTGLLSGRPEPAEVLLQFFQENSAEKSQNRWLLEKLQKLRDLEFKDLTFSRSEIGRTLEDTESLTRFPPADLKILNVDEWWLSQELPQKHPLKLLGAAQPEHKFNQSESPLDQSGKLPSAQMTEADVFQNWDDFWLFEVEKTGPQEGTKRYAVPGYMDFGLFCINLELLSWSLQVGRRSKQKWPLFSERLQKLFQSRDTNALWMTILESLPRVWTNETIVKGLIWFDTGAKDTLICFVKDFLRHLGGKHVWGFSFDNGTRETSVCAFFELVWAFGGSHDFLKDSLTAKKNEEPITKALLFLQFLIMERFMPDRATVETTRSSLFSRHFYSTFQEAYAPPELPIGQDAGSDTLPRVSPIFALPFFPVGTAKGAGDHLIADLRARLSLMHSRLKKAADGDVSDLLESIGRLQDMLGHNGLSKVSGTKVLAATHTVGDQLIKALDRLKSNVRVDLLEVWRWHVLRTRLLLDPSKSLTRLLQAFGKDNFQLPQTPAGDGASFPTGYSCTGSWMYGIPRSTRSLGLANDILQELTSLDAARNRARIGAGLSARKDFFQLHGSDSVPGIEYLSWEQLLRYCGSRARRRERVISEKMNPSDVYARIHEQLLHCYSNASLYRSMYEQSSTRQAAIQKAHDAAKNVVREIDRITKAEK